MRASVVVPVCNGESMIADCLESLLAQDLAADEFEVIVVENGSTDRTAEIVERYPVRLLRREQPGLSAARNYGAAAARGEIVAFTDSDCIAVRGWLRALLDLYADPQVGGVGGPIVAHAGAARGVVERFSETKPPLVNFSTAVPGESSREFLPYLVGANCSYRKRALDELGGFDESLLYSEDVELSWRLQLAQGKQLRLAAGAVVEHRHRMTLADLARQYRRYGFGEIVLDTLFRQHPGYPRTFAYQCAQIGRQCLALPRYAGSAAVRALRWARGRATSYDVAVPLLWMVVESNAVVGKLDAMIKTRLMRDPRGNARGDPLRLYFGARRRR